MDFQLTRSEHCAPVADTIHHPLQFFIFGPLLSTDQAVLHFCEVALEEAYLMFFIWRRRMQAGVLHAEMIIHHALVDWGGGLWDKLRSQHIVAVPDGSFINCYLYTSFASRVRRVLVLACQFHVFRYRPAAMNVVLVGTDWVRPRPVVQKS